MITTDQVQAIIEKALPGAEVEVRDMTGTSDHFDITVVSEAFQGKSIIDQHKLVFKILDHEMKKDRIHAVQLKTKVPK